MIGFGLLVLLLVACSDANDTPSSGEKDNNINNEGIEEEPEDVTLLFLSDFSEEYFDEYVKEVIEEEFSYITLDYIHGTSLDFEELIAEGSVPDLFRVENLLHVKSLAEFDMDFPLDDLIEKYSFDLDALEPNLMEFIRRQNDDHKILALPYNQTVWGTFYNKDVFDQFGQAYPEDGMTWDEIIDLAAEVTGERNGVQYRGLHIDIPSDAASAYPVSLTDPETGKSLMQEEEAFTNFFTMIDKMANIPGNLPEGDEQIFKTWGGAFTEGNIAMMPYYGPSLYFLDTDGLDWDVVTYPTWDDQPGVGPLANGHANAISPHTEHKDAAFQVISYLASEEYQMMLAKEGEAPSVVNQDILDVFAEEVEGVEDLNLEAFFAIDPSLGPENVSKYDEFVGLWDKAGEFIESGDDVNTFLRKLDDEFNAAVEAGKADKGWD